MTAKNKILLTIGIAAAAGLFLWGRSCGIGSVMKTVGSDTALTVTKTDTVYKPYPVSVTKDSIVYVPKTKTVHDTLEIFEVRIDPADTVAILKDYNAKRFYVDTQKLARGYVTISDTVSRNRITSRRLQTFNIDTTITNTVTLQQPKKLILYFGLTVIGNRKDPFHLGTADLTLKGFNDKQYGALLGVNRAGEIFYGVKYAVPIRLKKRP